MNIYTGTTSFEHPVTGDEITVRVTFRVYPPEPDVGVFGNTYEVTDWGSDVASDFSDDGVDDHVDDLPDAWFADVILNDALDYGDYMLERQRDRQMEEDL